MTDLLPYQTSHRCQVHLKHTPAPAYQELHHIIPQAWQIIYQPQGFDCHSGPLASVPSVTTFPNWGKSPDRAGIYLWDARTVAVCRTGHGNVHYWLVNLMRAYQKVGSMNAAIKHVTAEAKTSKESIDRLSFDYTQQAIDRFLLAGGSLSTLWAAGEWGAI